MLGGEGGTHPSSMGPYQTLLQLSAVHGRGGGEYISVYPIIDACTTRGIVVN